MEPTMKHYMLKVLVACGLFMAFAMPAQANWNIRQKDNGSTVWVNPQGIEVPTGDSGLVVTLTDLNIAQTAFVVSHKKGKIKKVYAVQQGTAFTGSPSAVLTIGIGNGTSAGFTPISPVGATISVPTTAGLVGSATPWDVNVDVSQGYVISVATDGASLGGGPAVVTIVIE
jgi:hypothetical protein